MLNLNNQILIILQKLIVFTDYKQKYFCIAGPFARIVCLTNVTGCSLLTIKYHPNAKVEFYSFKEVTFLERWKASRMTTTKSKGSWRFHHACKRFIFILYISLHVFLLSTWWTDITDCDSHYREISCYGVPRKSEIKRSELLVLEMYLKYSNNKIPNSYIAENSVFLYIVHS